MFLGTFAWSFVYVSLPFHIRAMSPFDATATLTWTGWILGISNLATVVVAPVWGRFAERADTKALYGVTQVLQGLALFRMALARTLPELFVSRLGLALIVRGGSTQGFFLTSILPQVRPELGVAPERTLELGGVLIFVSGAAAAIGALATTRLAELFAERRLLVTLLCAASALQAALAVAHSVWLYGVIRFLQVLCLAPVF